MTRNKKISKKDLRISAITKLGFKQNKWSLAAYCRYSSITKEWASQALLGTNKTPSALKLKAQLIKASKEPRPDDWDKSLPA
jgi:hypothetical protein